MTELPTTTEFHSQSSARLVLQITKQRQGLEGEARAELYRVGEVVVLKQDFEHMPQHTLWVCSAWGNQSK